jgi:hypothetical protein
MDKSQLIKTVPSLFIVNPRYINYISYRISSFQFNTSIVFDVVLYDENSSPLEIKKVSMEGDQYLLWGKDDTYAINFILSSLNLVLDTPSIPTPTPTV